MRYLLSILFLSSIIFFSFLPTQPAEAEEPVAAVPKEKEPVIFTVDENLKAQVEALAQAHGLLADNYAISIVNYETGQSYGYNEYVPFTAASLYKLPLAMLYYEDLNNGVLPADQGYTYLPEHFEDGGNLSPERYYTDIPVDELLHYIIQNSDNNSAHVLYENRGGWSGYIEQRSRFARFEDETVKQLQQDYDRQEMEARQNQVTAAYMQECLKYLVENKEQFSILIEDLAIAQPDTYLNGHLPSYYDQKYGAIGSCLNIAGLSFQEGPYGVVVLSVGLEQAEAFMADLGVLLKDYFDPNIEMVMAPAQKEAPALEDNTEIVVYSENSNESLLKPES